jgi:hypothetical protein
MSMHESDPAGVARAGVLDDLKHAPAIRQRLQFELAVRQIHFRNRR